MRHTIPIAAATLTAAGVLVSTSSARAQEENYLNRPQPAPSQTLELKAGTGYTQGFGLLTPTQSIHDVAGAGIGVDIDVDYRVNPRVSVGLQGEYQEFANNTANNFAARGMAANVGVTYHASPFVHGDPWLRIGTGYRGLWDVGPTNGQPTTYLHGLEFAKATAGYDVRVSQNVAIAPVIGADLDAFLWQIQNGSSTTLGSPKLGTFVFGGVQGRFDVGGTTETRGVAGR